MPIFVLALFFGLVFLVVSADRFVLGAAAVARNLGVSSLVIGLTVVGFGTSAPEMLVSALAAWQGNPGLAVGNALGSNIANIGLVLGSTALLAPIMVRSETLRKELLVLLFVTLGCYLLSLDGVLGVVDGGVMLVALVTILWWMVRAAKQNRQDSYSVELESEKSSDFGLGVAIFWTLLGLLGLVLSSRLLIWAAVEIAQFFGVSDLVIGLTVVALGTSLPELATSIGAVLKKEDDLAIGNVIGSNLYNLLAVYSLPGIIRPGALEASVLSRDFPWMIGFTIALFIIGYGFFKRRVLGRLEGGLLVVAFVAYQWLVLLGAT